MDEIYKVIRWVLDHEIELKSTFVLTEGDIVETAKVAIKQAHEVGETLEVSRNLLLAAEPYVMDMIGIASGARGLPEEINEWATKIEALIKL